MAYYENSGQVNDEAISIAGGRTFQVIQLADSEGNIINPASGELVFNGDVVIGSEIEISNDIGNPVPVNDADGSLTVDSPAIGEPDDTSATSDTGTFGIIALFKRALQGITSIIGYVDSVETVLGTIDTDTGSIDAKLPSLSSGRIPVDIGAISLGDVEIKNDNGNPIPTSVPVRTPTTTSVASSASSGTILAANVNRRGISIHNQSSSTLYLSFSATATVSNSFLGMAPGSVLFLDQQLMVTNAITGIWTSANGTAQVTEYV